MITASCDCDGLSISEVVAEKAGQILGQAAIELSKNADSSLNQAYLCNNQGNSNQTRQDFENTLETVIENTNSPYHLLRDKHQIALLSPPIKMNFEIQNKTYKLKIGTWDSTNKFKPYGGYEIKAVKRFFRVGIVLAEPWAWIDGAQAQCLILNHG